MNLYGLKPQEEQCRLTIDDWLKQGQISTYTWLPEIADPPDIWLKTNKNCYGVEITSVHGNAPNGLPGKTVSDSLSRIGEEIAKAVPLKLSELGLPLKHYYRLSLAPSWTGKRIIRKNVTKYFVNAISAHYIGYIKVFI